LPIFRGFSGILVAFLIAGIRLGGNCDFVRAGAKQQGVTLFQTHCLIATRNRSWATPVKQQCIRVNKPPCRHCKFRL
jgi:hypothetical protein